MVKVAGTEKLKTLDAKIGQLQARKKRLEEKRKNQISTILNRCGASKMPDEILAGALLEAARAYNQKDPRVGQWQSEGQKIVRPGRGKKRFI